MADNALIEKLAEKIAARSDLPYIPEQFEAPIISGALKLALGQLPDEYIPWIQSASDGIDETEAAGIKAWLVTLMNRHGSAVPEKLRTWAAGAVVVLLQRGTAVVLE